MTLGAIDLLTLAKEAGDLQLPRFVQNRIQSLESDSVYLKNIRAFPIEYYQFLIGRKFIFECKTNLDLFILRKHFSTNLDNLANYYVEIIGDIKDFCPATRTFLKYFSPLNATMANQEYTNLPGNDNWNNIFLPMHNERQLFFINKSFPNRIAKCLVAILSAIDCEESDIDFIPNLLLLGGEDKEIAEYLQHHNTCQNILVAQRITRYQGPNTLWSQVISRSPYYLIRHIRVLNDSQNEYALYWIEGPK